MVRFRDAAIVTAIGALADLLSTMPVVGLDGLREANPIALKAFDVFGPFIGMVVVKAVGLVLILGLALFGIRRMQSSADTERQKRIGTAYMTHVVLFSGVFQLVVAVNNLLLVLQVI